MSEKIVFVSEEYQHTLEGCWWFRRACPWGGGLLAVTAASGGAYSMV